MIEDEVRELHPDAQSIYFNAIANGTTPQLAIAFATKQSPVYKGSDRTLNQTQRRHMMGMSAMNRERIVQIAEKAGIRTHGKFYVGGLGRYNDPAAWVSTYDDALDSCKKKNLTADGIVYHKGHEVPPPPRKALADDLVNEFVADELKNPKTAEQVKANPKKLNEVREKVIAKHGKKRD